MTGTTQTSKMITLEDVTRRCSEGLASRASVLEEAIGHARRAKTHVAEAEQQIASGLSALAAVKPVFEGSSEYMLNCSRLVAGVSSDLEKDATDLRQIRTTLEGVEEPTQEILQQMLTFSVDAIRARIRGRMSKLGGDFSVPPVARPLTSSVLSGALSRRRPESLVPPRELSLVEIEDGVSMDSLLQAGLENFDRGAAMLETCFDALRLCEGTVTQAKASLEALAQKYRMLQGLEAGATSTEISGAIEELEKLALAVNELVANSERISGVSERARVPLLAVFENMGKLLVSGIVAEGNPAEARKTAAQEALQQALRGDISGIPAFANSADELELQAVSDALHQAARTQEIEVALSSVAALRSLALEAPGARAEADDNLVSLSNSPSVPEQVRDAATQALLDLTDSTDPDTDA